MRKYRLAHEFKFTSWTVFPPNPSEVVRRSFPAYNEVLL